MKENADDVALAAEIRSEHVECIDPHFGEDQFKVLTVGDHPEAADQTPITLQNHTLQDVTSFSYLGGLVEQTGKVEKEVATIRYRKLDSVADLETKRH